MRPGAARGKCRGHAARREREAGRCDHDAHVKITSPVSGDQIELHNESHHVTITAVGATLRTYTVDGADVVDGFGNDEMAPMGRGQVLAPFPNRIEDGRYTFEGTTLQLPVNEVAWNNAIHGLVRWANWTIRVHTSSRAVMALVLHPQPGYPFTLELTVDYTLSHTGLEVITTAVNRGASALPYGTGAHPWFTVGIPVEDTILHVPARSWLISDDRMIPTGTSISVAGSDHDFTTPRPVGARAMDVCFTDLPRIADGRASVTIATPAGNRRVTVWMNQEHDHVMIFTGDLAAEPSPHSIAIEPMTCAPDAFHNGRGLRILQPGGMLTSRWGITPQFGSGT